MKRLSTFLALLAAVALSTAARADGDGGTCFICKKTSTKECVEAVFCRSPSGKDTPADRKRCRNLGCEIGGTATCKIRDDMPICGDDPDAHWDEKGRRDNARRPFYSATSSDRCSSKGHERG